MILVKQLKMLSLILKPQHAIELQYVQLVIKVRLFHGVIHLLEENYPMNLKVF